MKNLRSRKVVILFALLLSIGGYYLKSIVRYKLWTDMEISTDECLSDLEIVTSKAKLSAITEPLLESNKCMLSFEVSMKPSSKKFHELSNECKINYLTNDINYNEFKKYLRFLDRYEKLSPENKEFFRGSMAEDLVLRDKYAKDNKLRMRHAAWAKYVDELLRGRKFDLANLDVKSRNIRLNIIYLNEDNFIIGTDSLLGYPVSLYLNNNISVYEKKWEGCNLPVQNIDKVKNIIMHIELVETEFEIPEFLAAKDLLADNLDFRPLDEGQISADKADK